MLETIKIRKYNCPYQIPSVSQGNATTNRKLGPELDFRSGWSESVLLPRRKSSHVLNEIDEGNDTPLLVHCVGRLHVQNDKCISRATVLPAKLGAPSVPSVAC